MRTISKSRSRNNTRIETSKVILSLKVLYIRYLLRGLAARIDTTVNGIMPH